MKYAYTMAMHFICFALAHPCAPSALADESKEKFTLPIADTDRILLAFNASYVPSPSGRLLTVSTKDTWTLWDLATQKALIRDIEKGGYPQVAFGPNENSLISTTAHSIFTWDIKALKKNVKTIDVGTDFDIATIKVSQSTIAVFTRDGMSKIYDVNTHKLLSTVEITPRQQEGDRSVFVAAMLSSDGKVVARAYNRSRSRGASTSEEIEIIDAYTGKINLIIKQNPDDKFQWSSAALQLACISGDGKLVATYGSRGSVSIFSTQTAKVQVNLDLPPKGNSNIPTRVMPDIIKFISFSEDSSELLSTDAFGNIYIFTIASGNRSRFEKSVVPGPNKLFISANSKFIAVQSPSSFKVLDLFPK